MSRKKNTILNAIAGGVSELLVMILKFVTRTFFIRYLGTEYLGINGLFTNVLQVLALSELGIGTAMNFQLYQPLAYHDEERVRVLMKFYRNAYRFVGLTILILGFCLIPFLPYLIKDYDQLGYLGVNAVVIFFLYLMQNVTTYVFFAYKSALIKADQKEYVLAIVGYIITVVTYLSQILILKYLRNFELYTSSVILFNLMQNYINAKIVDKRYPYIKIKTDKKLSKNETLSILKNCSVLFIFLIHQVVLNATDNIVISSKIGLVVVGLYSNYMMIYNTIKIFLIRAMNAVKASIGNLHATNNYEKEFLIFKVINYLSVVIYGISFVGIGTTADIFIKTWVGQDYVMGRLFCLLMGIEIYFQGYRQLFAAFRETMGIYERGKIVPLITVFLNVILSVVLVKSIGVYGVMIGTIVSELITTMWHEPLVIYRCGFKDKSLLQYFLKNIGFVIPILFSYILVYKVCDSIFLNTGWMSIVLRGFCSIVITLIFTVFPFIKSDEVMYLFGFGKKIVQRIK